MLTVCRIFSCPEFHQDRLSTYNVTTRPFRGTIFDVEKQQVIYILNECVYVWL